MRLLFDSNLSALLPKQNPHARLANLLANSLQTGLGQEDIALYHQLAEEAVDVNYAILKLACTLHRMAAPRDLLANLLGIDIAEIEEIQKLGEKLKKRRDAELWHIAQTETLLAKPTKAAHAIRLRHIDRIDAALGRLQAMFSGIAQTHAIQLKRIKELEEDNRIMKKHIELLARQKPSKHSEKDCPLEASFAIQQCAEDKYVKR